MPAPRTQATGGVKGRQGQNDGLETSGGPDRDRSEDEGQAVGEEVRAVQGWGVPL